MNRGITPCRFAALFFGEYVEAAVLSFRFIVGVWLEIRTLGKTVRSLHKPMDLAPQEAQVVRDGVMLTVGVGDITPRELSTPAPTLS